MYNRCIGSGTLAVVAADGIGFECATCGLKTIPYKCGTIRAHSSLGTTPAKRPRPVKPCPTCAAWAQRWEKMRGLLQATLMTFPHNTQSATYRGVLLMMDSLESDGREPEKS